MYPCQPIDLHVLLLLWGPRGGKSKLFFQSERSRKEEEDGLQFLESTRLGWSHQGGPRKVPERSQEGATEVAATTKVEAELKGHILHKHDPTRLRSSVLCVSNYIFKAPLVDSRWFFRNRTCCTCAPAPRIYFHFSS